MPLPPPSPVACTFSCMMKFTVKDCDPNTGEADEEGYEDEYVVRSWACGKELGICPVTETAVVLRDFVICAH